MLNEFRYRGIAKNGQAIQGKVLAHSKSKAKKIILQLSEKHKLRINSIVTKQLFLYTITI